MAPRKTNKKPEVAVAVVAPATPMIPKKELVLEGDPEKQLEFAQKAAKALMTRVNGKPKQVIINNKQYLEFGDWQTLARFFGATVGVEWTSPVEAAGKVVGFDARAIVYQHGNVISSAEASCMRSERTWAGREEFALKSMAQTRASAKALRNAFGWVAELAGYASTPAEEMGYDSTPVPTNAKVISYGTEDPGGDETAYAVDSSMSQDTPEMVCSDTGKPISKAEYEYSIKFYGKPLSRDAQKKHARIK